MFQIMCSQRARNKNCMRFRMFAARLDRRYSVRERREGEGGVGAGC